MNMKCCYETKNVNILSFSSPFTIRLSRQQIRTSRNCSGSILISDREPREATWQRGRQQRGITRHYDRWHVAMGSTQEDFKTEWVLKHVWQYALPCQQQRYPVRSLNNLKCFSPVFQQLSKKARTETKGDNVKEKILSQCVLVDHIVMLFLSWFPVIQLINVFHRSLIHGLRTSVVVVGRYLSRYNWVLHVSLRHHIFKRFLL